MQQIFKALASQTRLRMLYWLKAPQKHFPPPDPDAAKGVGVSVSDLQRKADLSPSTASAHLAILQRAGLVRATRVGQWTYYQRDEAAIRRLAAWIRTDL
jgi:DNA-binding transcriptional ArsR family regulator